MLTPRRVLVGLAALLGLAGWCLVGFTGNASGTGRLIAIVGITLQVVAARGTLRSSWPNNFTVAGLGLVTVFVPTALLILSAGIVFTPSVLAWGTVWVWIWRADGHLTTTEAVWPGLVVGGFGCGLVLLNSL